MTSPVVKLFLDLVRIDSPSGDEEKIAAFIVDFLAKLGIKADRDSYGNVIAQVENTGEPIIISCHMDTVEPGRSIKPIIENNIIKSDGTTILGADNKAWLAAILAGLENLTRQSINLRNLDLVFTRQEETQNGGSSHLDLKMIRGKRGFSCDDGSLLGAIFFRSPYYIRIDISVIGKAAHSAEPDKASNALKAAAEAIHKLPLGQIGNSTIRNIGVMNSGHGRNTVPGEVALVAEIRSFTKQRLAEATAEMIKMFREVGKKHGCSIKKLVELENPGFEIGAKDRTLLEAKRVLETVGIEPRLEETYGCFDANYFSARGIHVINMSDGSEESHTTREKIKVEHLVKLQEIAERLMTGEEI